MTKTEEILSELRLSQEGRGGRSGTWGNQGKEGGFQTGKETISGPYLVTTWPVVAGRKVPS